MTCSNKKNYKNIIILILFAPFLVLIVSTIISNKAFAVTPNWVDTQNTTGSKIYLDTNNQYYFEWGQVYTIKYDKNGKTLYTQIELKGVRGNKAAILSVDDEYKNIYLIPRTRKYIDISPDQAIYNSYATNMDGVDFGSYMDNLERLIKKNWTPPKNAQSKRVVVLFKIAKDGRLIDLKISKSSGDKETDDAALKAVRNTAFRPLPYGYNKDSVDIEFTFDYNVINGY